MNNKDNSLGLTDINIAILYFKQTRFLLSEGWKRTNTRTENKDHHMGYRHSLCGVLRKKSLLGYSKQVQQLFDLWGDFQRSYLYHKATVGAFCSFVGEKNHSSQHSKKQRGTGRDKHHSTPLHLDTVVKLSDKLPIKCPLGTYF